MKEGDVIISINGTSIKSSPELQEQVGRYRPGDEIAVTIVRGGEEKTLSVTLRNRDGETRIKRNEAAQVLGASLESAKDSEISRLGIQHGVKVKELNSGKLKSAGLREGFIITSIDNKAVKSPQEVLDYLELREGGVLIEGIYPNGMKAFYGFGM
ncbi:MAG: PDZ domain-containing protein [Bacteroidota bacterium]